MLDAASCHCLGIRQILHCKIPSSGQKAAAVLIWELTLLCAITGGFLQIS